MGKFPGYIENLNFTNFLQNINQNVHDMYIEV